MLLYWVIHLRYVRKDGWMKALIGTVCSSSDSFDESSDESTEYRSDEETMSLHTSKLESFNSMVLKYAPKQIGFAYESFLARILPAILDHNFHAFHELVEGRFKKVYSKRSNNWHVVPVKVEKHYKY